MRPARALRALFAAVVLVPAALAAPATAPLPVRAAGPLPECRLDDVTTQPRGYDDWATTLVDWNLGVGRGYKPPDLVSIYNAGVTGGGYVRKVAFDDLKEMADAARKAGVPLGSVSAYRSFQQQVKLFRQYARGYGFDEAITFSARPGHSEHQLGLVIDFAAAGTTTCVNEKTPTGAWLAKNAWKYGWLMSYPDGKDELVCYHYEPWHYRYVGRDHAKKIHDAGVTIREYLWANFTQLDSACVAAPQPERARPMPVHRLSSTKPSPPAAPRNSACRWTP